MSQAQLRKIIGSAFSHPESRLALHDAKCQAAEAMGKSAYADMLFGKALDAVTRSSANAYVTLTPQQAIQIALILKGKK